MDALAARCDRPGARPCRSLEIAAVELDRVTLARGGRMVLTEVSAAIRPGEFIGVFGPNGSGKTTLLRALLGLLPPISGKLRVFGASPGSSSRAAGYLPQQRTAVADLPLRGWDFVASAWRGERWGLPFNGRARRQQVEQAIERVGAQPLAYRRLSQLSGGELQRLLLAQALLGRAEAFAVGRTADQSRSVFSGDDNCRGSTDPASGGRYRSIHRP